MEFDVIDFHTHPFYEDDENLCIYKSNMKMDMDTFLADMDEAGVSVFCGSVIKKTRDNGFENLKECNRVSLRLRDIYGERYQPGFHLHPEYMDESYAEIKLAAEKGVRIIGELVPYLHGWTDFSCKEFSDLLDEVAKHNMVVSVHSMDMGQMEKMASAHRDIQFVFAHPDEKVNVDVRIGIMKKLDNVSIDLSGTGLYRYGLTRYLIDNVGADRVLFGTDYPICNLPMYIHAVLGEKLTDREKELVLSGNAKRLLGL